MHSDAGHDADEHAAATATVDASPDPANRVVTAVEAKRAREALLRGLRRATRGALVRTGLHRVADPTDRPTPRQRRDALARATATGLTAPIFALDGLPTALEAPATVAWDALSTGSVVVHSGTVAAAGSPVGPTEDAEEPLSARAEVRLITDWVRAIGMDGPSLATDDEVARAAARLQVAGVEEISSAGIRAVKGAVLEQSRDVLIALGLATRDDPVDSADVLAAAHAMGIPTPDGVTPGLVAGITEQGRPLVEEYLHTRITPYAQALGINVGERIDPHDLEAVAAELAIDLPDLPDATAVERLHHAWLQTLRPHFEQLGIDPGGTVDPGDVEALARALGANLDGGTGPAPVSRLVALLERFGPAVPFARVAGVDLSLPSEHIVAAGFHQASSSIALPMQPISGPNVGTMESRGRATSPHSAIDVAVAHGTDVLSPVSGTVVEATPYLLYGTHPDTRVRIRPDDNPALIVSVIHVTGSFVREGDHVTAGQPIADHGTRFPFFSQIDGIAGALPHVHVEVKYAGT